MATRTRASVGEKSLSRPPVPPSVSRVVGDPDVEMMRPSAPPPARRSSHKPILVAAVVALIAAGAIIAYLWKQTQDLKKQLTMSAGSAPDAAQQAKETDALVAEVGKLMELPTDETPSVYDITDTSTLPQTPFFAHAKSGDKLLIYQKALKAILYDPNEHKIVEVAPVTTSSADATPNSSNSADSSAP